MSKGRIFTKEMQDLVLDELWMGSISLAAICRENPELPCTKTIDRFRKANPEYNELFLKAREQGLDNYAYRLFDDYESFSIEKFSTKVAYRFIQKLKKLILDKELFSKVEECILANCSDPAMAHSEAGILKEKCRHAEWVISKRASQLYGDKLKIEETTVVEHKSADELEKEIIEIDTKLKTNMPERLN